MTVADGELGAANQDPPLIEFRGVTKTFGDLVVYENMDLSIHSGETFTIIGGSGKGKSVCLKLMIGLLLPDAGDVLFRGKSVPNMDEDTLREVRRKISYVFQGGALFDSLSVLDNIGYALREHTSDSDEQIRARASECLDMVGLSQGRLELSPSKLSGGEKKRVALARSIATRPEVILYDEPTTGLDPKNIARIGEMIMKLQRELRVTSIVVTHDMPTAHKVSDRIAMLHERRFPYVDSADAMWNSVEPDVRNFIHGNLERAYGA